MKRPALFLDRDGVINLAPPAGQYISRREQVELLPNIVDWIRLFNLIGYLVIVVTNQRAVARGMLTAEEIDYIHQGLIEELARRGARVDDVFFCPHEEDECDCRKPKTGLIRQACEKWKIDLGRSLLIGDSDRDRHLARNAGLRFILVRQGAIIEAVEAFQ